jgi:hypothetical protein
MEAASVDLPGRSPMDEAPLNVWEHLQTMSQWLARQFGEPELSRKIVNYKSCGESYKLDSKRV